MNCKPGDLAIFVRSFAGNEGKIVQCLRLATTEELRAENFIDRGPVWLLDREVAGVWLVSRQAASQCHFAIDACLRPIRDPGEEATDETLLWQEVPKQVERA